LCESLTNARDSPVSSENIDFRFLPISRRSWIGRLAGLNFLHLGALLLGLEIFPLSGQANQNLREPSQTATSNGVIARIDFLGNRRTRSETLRARIFSRAGDPYREETLRRDFQALWNTSFFEDIKLTVDDAAENPNLKIITFRVTERPVIRRIRYEDIHSVSESDTSLSRML
jgi:outer membrane protein assembly factor BamA